MFCRAADGDLPAVTRRVAQFQRELVKCNADILTAERRLRRLLGLPQFDGRRIVPVASPRQERIVFDWDVCWNAVLPAQRGGIRQPPWAPIRALLEVESAYAAYATAKRLRIEADERLDAQRSYWEKGRMTAARCLDGVEEFAALVASEHRQLAAYNSAIAVLEDCRATLLDKHNMIVAAAEADLPGAQERLLTSP